MKFTISLRTSMYTTVGALLLTLSSFAQAPEKMSYQAVIRGANNALVTNQQVGMQISILQGSTAVYEETHTPTSNTNGLVSLEIGTGTVISGSFTAIDWSADTYFIKTETDPTGGTNYTITGTNQLLSVPFALYAKTSSDAGAVAANTAKVGYTDALVSAHTDVAANTVKVGYTEALVSANTNVAANTAKVGITSAQATAIVENTSKTGITTQQADAITTNTAKVGYRDALVSSNTAVAANTAKVVITAQQANAITTNTAKVGYTEALVSANTAVAANTAKVGITSAQATAIVENTSKTGITTQQANAITTNTAKVGYTEALVSANTHVAANTAKVGITTEQATAILENTSKTGGITTHFIGESYGGGIVFFVYDGGQHGLIAATADQSAGVPWFGGSYTNTRARADGIGAGLKNTAIIIADQGPVDNAGIGNDFAATLCNEYSVTVDGVTYGDWYLPSKYELNQMYINRSTLEAVSGFNAFTTSFYWSSTETDTSFAWRQYFYNGAQDGDNKANTTHSVRAVRAF